MILRIQLSNSRCPSKVLQLSRFLVVVRPISEQQLLDGKMVGIEVGRSCSFDWGGVPILKNLQIRL